MKKKDTCDCARSEPVFFEIKGEVVFWVRARCSGCGKQKRRAPLPSDVEKAMMLAFI